MKIFHNLITLKEYFLINISPNNVRVENLKTHEFRETELEFGNKRLLITDMNEPESTLRQLIAELSSPGFIRPSRTIIINPFHPQISMFSEIEKMAFRDMAEHLGARIVRFKFGETITGRQLDISLLKTQTEV